ncbi:MAG: PP2C family protein-serine/threonine phosphatase [Pseudonocardiaceae bacterium]
MTTRISPGLRMSNGSGKMLVVDRQLAHQVRLAADHRSPMLARRILRATLHDAGLDDLIDDAVLLTSELCENVVLHVGTDYELIIDLSDTELTVRVIDHGPTALELHRATPRPPTDRAATHGRGLLLVESIAAAWGTRHDASGHQVWFALRRGPVEPAVEVATASPSSRPRHAAQVATSQALQQALLPAADGVEFATAYLSASSGMDAGGDFSDVVEVGDGCWLVSISDGCGKAGVAAARTGLIRAVLRVLVREGRPPAQALELLNEMMLEAGDPSPSATVALALIGRRPAAQEGLSVELVLAGHEQPVVVGADGTVTLVGRPGTAAGLVSGFAVHPTRHLLKPGEALVIYTNGVTECRHGDKKFGQARLLETLAGVGGSSAAAIVAELRRAVESFSPEPQPDDIAVIVVRAPCIAP